MSIYLNGVKIPGYGLRVSANLVLAGEDLSGNSSSTTQAEKGDKPKTISVRTTIKFTNPGELSAIYQLAESRASSTDRTVYNIINDTAQALNMRQVTFQGNVDASEQYNLRCWDVTFTLVEHRSVPEKKQARAQAKAKAKPVTTQRAAGQPVAPVSTASASGSTTETVTLTPFEEVLKAANDKIKAL
ncbi:hypothetical protein JWZ98_03100 [Methylomonas sp. EFPC1]|uniref:baseplate complex protein n=1 Tax=Methylomonas sp. EFPC1 TaxID=2812647 RepID=UPI001966FA97|nr:hypothetical protein [Methylomonas sp. EFPC1]QSB01963.1 hypothetical protein JWZ98_03100 [Methylomonas sp. EFPC1]